MAGELDRTITELNNNVRCLDSQLHSARLTLEGAERQLELLRHNLRLLKGLMYKHIEGVNHD